MKKRNDFICYTRHYSKFSITTSTFDNFPKSLRIFSGPFGFSPAVFFGYISNKCCRGEIVRIWKYPENTRVVSLQPPPLNAYAVFWFENLKSEIIHEIYNPTAEPCVSSGK